MDRIGRFEAVDDRFHLNGAPRETFDLPQQPPLVPCAKGNRDARGTGSGSSTDPMDVRLGVVRQIEIQHMGDIADVQAARRNIGGHQDRWMLALKLLQGSAASRLAHVAVDGGCVVPVFLQTPDDLIRTVLGATEYERPGLIGFSKKTRQEIRLAALVDQVNRLTDPLHGYRLRCQS